MPPSVERWAKFDHFWWQSEFRVRRVRRSGGRQAPGLEATDTDCEDGAWPNGLGPRMFTKSGDFGGHAGGIYEGPVRVKHFLRIAPDRPDAKKAFIRPSLTSKPRLRSQLSSKWIPSLVGQQTLAASVAN